MKKECKVRNGKLYCRKKNKWVLVGNNKVNILSSKPFKKDNFKRKRTNVC